MARKTNLAAQREPEVERHLEAFEVIGCPCEGETVDEMVKNIQDAIDRYLEVLAVEESVKRLSR